MAEQLEPVLVDPIAGLAFDVADDGAQTGIVGVAAATATRADHVVVVRRLAGHVGVVAGRQIESFDRPQLGEHVQRPEDRGSPDPQAAAIGVVDQVGGGEVAVASGDQVDDGPSGRGRAIAGPAEGRIDRGTGGLHVMMILSINTRCPVGGGSPDAVPLDHRTFVRLCDRARPAQTHRHGTGPLPGHGGDP